MNPWEKLETLPRDDKSDLSAWNVLSASPEPAQPPFNGNSIFFNFFFHFLPSKP
jgi:hypothetical protein